MQLFYKAILNTADYQRKYMESFVYLNSHNTSNILQAFSVHCCTQSKSTNEWNVICLDDFSMQQDTDMLLKRK
jgi:hypothetical protein